MADMKIVWRARVLPAAITNTVAPVASGLGEIGETLTVTDGTWSATPDSFEYRWKRDGSIITDEELNAYALAAADDETDVTAEVRAQKNGVWSAWAASNAIAITYPTPELSDVRIVPPFGDSTTTFDFEYDGDVPGAVITQQWQLDNANIPGATGATRQQPTDGNLTVEVTATNSGGSHTLESQVVAIVSPEIFGVTQGGTALNTGNYSAPFPAYESGDLVVLVAGIEAQGKTLTFPVQTPGGEAIFPIAANHNIAGSDITLSAVGWIGTGTRVAGTIDVVVVGGPDQWTTAALHFPSGTVDDAAPIDSIALGGTGTAATSSSTPAFTVTNANATILHLIFADGTAPSGIAAGYRANNIWTPGSVAAMVASRNSLSTAAEPVPAVAVSFPSAEVWSGISLAFNANGSPTLTRVPDCTVLPVASVASGTLGEVGNEISVTTGTWIGSPSATGYRWLKDGVTISGATSNAYTPVSGDVASVIQPQVRRENTVGFGAWTSAENSATIVASAVAPVVGVLPAQNYTEDTGIQTLDVAAVTTGDAPITYSRTPTNSAVTINATTGLLSTNTTNPLSTTTFTITATNSEGSGSRTVPIQISTPTAAGLFVATTGSNTTGTGSISAPWQTLAFAMSQLVPGNILNIRAGTYAGANVPVSGTQALPITIRPYPGEVVTLDGNLGEGSNGVLSITAKDWLIFDGLNGTDRNLRIINGSPRGFYIEGTSGQVHGNIVVQGLKISNCTDSGFYICGLIMGQTIPINTYRTEKITLRNNEVTAVNLNAPPGNEAITVGGGVREIIVEDNWIHDTHRYGIDFKLGVFRGIIRNNHIHNCEHHGIYLDCASRVCDDMYVYWNDVHDNSTTGITLTREAARDPGTHVALRNIFVWANKFSRNLRAFQCYRHGSSDTTLLGDIDNVNFTHNTCVDSTDRDLNLTGDSAWVNAVVSNFHIHNCIFNGGSAALTNQFTGAPGYSYSNNVTSNPSFINRAATHPDLHIPIGSTADNAGSATWLPATVLAGASAWFLANATVSNKDASGVNSFTSSTPACGAYEAG
jgi:hypothetical protein